jgi:hypothetical protein
MALALMSAGCPETYDFERQTPARGTFGEEVHTTLRKDARYSRRDPREREAWMQDQRARFVAAVDTTVPEPLLDPLNQLLVEMGPLHDEDLIADLTRKAALIFFDIADNEPIRRVWARDNLSDRASFKAPEVGSTLLAYIVNDPNLSKLNRFLIRMVLENDGFDDQGARVDDEPRFMTELLSVLSDTMTTTELTDDPDRVEALAAKLLWRADRRFQDPDASPKWVVRVDHRGKPLVRHDDRGLLYAPFVDRDGDELADLDADGNFVDFNGEVIPDAQPFGEPQATGLLVRDGLGRAHIEGEGFIFDYVDLHQTAGGFLLQQSHDLAERDVIFDMLDALQVMLPPREQALDPASGAEYEGYPEDNLVTDLVWGLLQVLDLPALDELLETAHLMLQQHEPILAEVLFSLRDFLKRLDDNPDATLTPGHAMGDDLMAAMEPLATSPGFIEDLLLAMRDPVVLEIGPATAELLDFKADRAVPTKDGPYERCFRQCDREYDAGTSARVRCVQSCPREEILVERVDRAAPPGPGNRSHFERVLALFRATSGLSYEMKVEELRIDALGFDTSVDGLLPPLLRIDNAAAAFVQAVSGDFVLVDYVTPEAQESGLVALLLNQLEGSCGPGFVNGIVQDLITILTTVTERDLERTCERFADISSDGALGPDDQKRHKLAVMVSFLSLLTDVPMSEQPSAGQLARFFNTPFPAVHTDVLDLTIAPLVDFDGYYMWEHHGDMLYAAEATGLLDAMRPMFQVVVRHGLEDEFVQMMAVMDLHYQVPEARIETADGGAAPRAGRGTGLVRYETTLRDWMLDDRLLPALRNLSVEGAQLRSSRGRTMPEILGEVADHAMRLDPEVRHRDGSNQSRRADGGMVRPTSRMYVLLDAIDGIDAALERDPIADEKWGRVTDELVDLVLEVDKRDTGEAYFVREGGLTLGRFVMEELVERAKVHRDDGRLHEFVTVDLYDDLSGLITGRGLPILVDVYNTATQSQEDRQLLRDSALYLLNGEGRAELLVVIYDLLLEMIQDEEGFVTAARFWGQTLDPAREWGEGLRPLPLVSHVMLLLERNLELDEDEILLEVVQRGMTPSSALVSETAPQGDSPMGVLSDVYIGYHRVEPGSDAPLSAEDYEQLHDDLGTWLLDDRRGMEQLYDLIDARLR